MGHAIVKIGTGIFIAPLGILVCLLYEWWDARKMGPVKILVALLTFWWAIPVMALTWWWNDF